MRVLDIGSGAGDVSSPLIWSGPLARLWALIDQPQRLRWLASASSASHLLM